MDQFIILYERRITVYMNINQVIILRSQDFAWPADNLQVNRYNVRHDRTSFSIR